MSSLLVVLIGTVLANTFLLMHDDPTLGGTRHEGSVASAMRIGGASAIALMIAALLTSLVWMPLRRAPLDTALFVFALATVVITFAIDRWAPAHQPRLARALVTSPVLVIANTLALGTLLLTSFARGLIVSFSMAFAVGVSFVATLTVFVTLISRIQSSEVPAPFRIAPISLVSAGLLALVLMGFTGLFRA